MTPPIKVCHSELAKNLCGYFLWEAADYDAANKDLSF